MVKVAAVQPSSYAMHLGGLLSTQEARVTRGVTLFSCLATSQVHARRLPFLKRFLQLNGKLRRGNEGIVLSGKKQGHFSTPLHTSAKRFMEVYMYLLSQCEASTEVHKKGRQKIIKKCFRYFLKTST